MHFYTISAPERDSAAPGGYRYEGNACYVYNSQAADTTPLYRLYRPQNAAHFYTTSAAERDHAIANDGYNSEGVACYVYSSQAQQTVPFYRLFNPQSGEHFYTTSAAERDHAITNDGFNSEGVACYVFDSPVAGTTPFYRLYLASNIGALQSLGLSNIHFDLNNAVMGAPQLVGESTQDLTNTTSVQQQETFTFEIDYSETQKWSATFGIKVGVTASITSGIPIIADGKITISTEISFSYTWGTEVTNTRKYTDAVPVNVPANSHVIATASVSTAPVTVPYSADAVYHFTSGQDIPGNFTGVFEGATAYLLQASWATPQPMS